MNWRGKEGRFINFAKEETNFDLPENWLFIGNDWEWCKFSVCMLAGQWTAFFAQACADGAEFTADGGCKTTKEKLQRTLENTPKAFYGSGQQLLTISLAPVTGERASTFGLLSHWPLDFYFIIFPLFCCFWPPVCWLVSGLSFRVWPRQTSITLRFAPLNGVHLLFIRASSESLAR